MSAEQESQLHDLAITAGLVITAGIAITAGLSITASWPSNPKKSTTKNLKQLSSYLYIHACKWHVRLLLQTISPGRGQRQETSKGPG